MKIPQHAHFWGTYAHLGYGYIKQMSVTPVITPSQVNVLSISTVGSCYIDVGARIYGLNFIYIPQDAT